LEPNVLRGGGGVLEFKGQMIEKKSRALRGGEPSLENMVVGRPKR